MTGFDPAAQGWRLMRGAAMPAGLGIPWSQRIDDTWHYGLLTGPEHANPNGVVHGGVMMAFADHMLSLVAWEAAGRANCTTIQLNTHFLDAIQPGAFLSLSGAATKRTRGLVFVRALLHAANAGGGRPVGAVDGIWRILRAA
jgi:acyl-coenzyme A thioesterase PaaI-like protein